MEHAARPPATVDAYIAGFPEDVRAILEQVRATVRSAAPGAVERIAYGMPTYTLHGNLVHFAAWKAHLGLYPAPTGIERFAAQLSAYPVARGSVRFPLDRPIPYDLIRDIVAFRVAENAARAAAKGRR